MLWMVKAVEVKERKGRRNETNLLLSPTLLFSGSIWLNLQPFLEKFYDHQSTSPYSVLVFGIPALSTFTALLFALPRKMTSLP